MGPADIEHRITPQTKVLMVVRLQGCPADMDRIMPIARKHNLKVLEMPRNPSAGVTKEGRSA